MCLFDVNYFILFFSISEAQYRATSEHGEAAIQEAQG